MNLFERLAVGLEIIWRDGVMKSRPMLWILRKVQLDDRPWKDR